MYNPLARFWMRYLPGLGGLKTLEVLSACQRENDVRQLTRFSGNTGSCSSNDSEFSENVDQHCTGTCEEKTLNSVVSLR